MLYDVVAVASCHPHRAALVQSERKKCHEASVGRLQDADAEVVGGSLNGWCGMRVCVVRAAQPLRARPIARAWVKRVFRSACALIVGR